MSARFFPYFALVCITLLLLTGCQPLQKTPTTSTPLPTKATVSPTPTASVLQKTDGSSGGSMPTISPKDTPPLATQMPSQTPFIEPTAEPTALSGIAIPTFHSTQQKKILIFVEQSLASSLTSELAQFSDDLHDDVGADVSMFIGNWDRATEIKSVILQNREDLYGIFLIGDLPYVKFARSGDPNLQWISDFYYSDLDNLCEYNSEHEFYDYQTCASSGHTYGPFVARLRPNSNVDRVQVLKDYFERNHEYRSGSLNFDPKMLYYNSVLRASPSADRENYIRSEQDAIAYASFYTQDDTTLLIATEQEDPEDIDESYLSYLSRPFEYVLVNNHGWYGGHEFSITNEKIEDTAPKPLFYQFKSCSVGNFEHDNVASAYIFSGQGLLALASTTDHFEFNYHRESATNFFLLKNGLSFAESFRVYYSLYNTWFGDPTLQLREHEQSGALIGINQTHLNLGRLQSAVRDMRVPFVVKNNGNQPLVLRTLSDLSIQKKEDEFISIRSDTYDYTTVVPGQTLTIQGLIDITLPPGHYEPVGLYIISNADNDRMIPITFEFEVV